MFKLGLKDKFDKRAEMETKREEIEAMGKVWICKNYHDNKVHKLKQEIKELKEKQLSPHFALFKDEAKERELERIGHKAHYNKSNIEAIDVIEDWDLNFGLGNVIKYIAKSDHKGSKRDDLEKAIFYLNRELDKI